MENNIENFANLPEMEQIMRVEEMTDENEIIEAIKQIEDETTKAYLLSFVMISEKMKLELAETLKNEYAKVMVITSLEDKKVRKEYVEKSSNEDMKAYILVNMQEELGSPWIYEQINKIKSPKNRTYIMSKLNLYKNRDKKREEINKIVNNYLEPEECHNTKYKKMGIDPKMTVGIEIEAEGMWSELLIEYQKNIWDWEIESEISLIGGVEIKSPHLRDREKEITEIYQITKMMKELGLSIGQSCGGHIHIGADYLNTLEEYKELFEIYGNAEEILYIISNKPNEIPRNGVAEYAIPVAEKWNTYKEIPKTKDEFIEVAKQIQGNSKTCSINVKNIGNACKNTIEFRVPNGTIDADVWIENIRLYGRIMQSAKEIAEIKNKHKEQKEITPEEQRKIIAKYKLKHGNSEDEKMKNLMELLFDEKEQEVYWQRYNTNKELIQESGFFERISFAKETVDMEER